MGRIMMEIKWALIFVTMSLVWVFGERLTGLHSTHIDQHPLYTNLVAIPAIAIYVFALLDKRKNYYGGKMSYKQGLISGFVLTLIITLLSPLTQYLASAWVSPDYFNNAIEHAVKVESYTRDQAESYFNLRNYIVLVLVTTPVMGLVTSLIVALFTRKS